MFFHNYKYKRKCICLIYIWFLSSGQIWKYFNYKFHLVDLEIASFIWPLIYQEYKKYESNWCLFEKSVWLIVISYIQNQTYEINWKQYHLVFTPKLNFQIMLLGYEESQNKTIRSGKAIIHMLKLNATYKTFTWR